MTLSPLPRLIIEPLVRAALVEDLGRAGDITTDAIVPAGDQAKMAIVARQAGTIAGLDLAAQDRGGARQGSGDTQLQRLGVRGGGEEQPGQHARDECAWSHSG